MFLGTIYTMVTWDEVTGPVLTRIDYDKVCIVNDTIKYYNNNELVAVLVGDELKVVDTRKDKL